MPKIEDILMMIEAGYSKAEIDALMNPAAESVAESEAQPAEEKVPEIKEQTPPEVLADNSEVLNKVLAEMAELKKQIQKRNLSETFTESVKEDRGVDILASIINPNQGGKK